LYISAGSGITPIMSHMTELLSTMPHMRISLIYANRNTDAIMFKDDIETLKDKNLQRLSVYNVFSREKMGIPLLYGRLDQDRCSHIIKGMIPFNDIEQVFICGPGEMILSAKAACEKLGMSPDKIHYELFSTDALPQQMSNNVAYVEDENYDPDTFSKITVKIDGEVITFPLAYGGQNILDAALENGADLPFACKGGVCSTCKAKVTSGEVMMSMNYSLEADEIAAHFTLTCQAHPRTSEVFVDFDHK
jgi:ring-1,2-phenylacetyl-CoA epoxidase subunit PaaE